MLRSGIRLMRRLPISSLTKRSFAQSHPTNKGILENTIFVAPLSSVVDDFRLKNEISKLLQDENSVIQTKASHPRGGDRFGIGFVELRSKELKNRLLDWEVGVIDEIPVRFQPAKGPINVPPLPPRPEWRPLINEPSQTLYLKNLSFTLTPNDLSRFLSRYGTIKQINMPMDHDGSFSGRAFVTFAEQSSAERVVSDLENEGLTLYNRWVLADYANEPSKAYLAESRSDAKRRDKSATNETQGRQDEREASDDKPTGEKTTVASPTIYLKYLSPTLSLQELTRFLTRFGHLKHIKMLEDEEGRPMGNAFATFAEQSAAERVVEASQGKKLVLKNRFLVVEFGDKQSKAHLTVKKLEGTKVTPYTNFRRHDREVDQMEENNAPRKHDKREGTQNQ